MIIFDCMNRILRLFLFIVPFASLLFMVFSTRTNFLHHSSGSPVQKAPDAWNALQFLNTMRAFPFEDIPKDAYSRAFNYYNREFTFDRQRTSNSAATWQNLGPVNVGGRTLGMAFHPLDTGIIWLGSASGGLWKSVTGGIGVNAWTHVPTGYPVRGVSCIAIDPDNSNVMYIGTGETYSYGTAVNGLVERPTRGSAGIGILKSVDGGNTWQPSLNWSYNQIRGVWDLQINPANPQTVFAATTEGVYKTTDGGITWNRVLNELMVMDILLDPDTSIIYAGVGNVGSPNPGIYRSVDAGNTWQRMNTGLPPATNTGKITLAQNKQNPNSLIALVADLYSTVGIYKSYNKGQTWSSINGLTEIVSYQGWFAKGLHMKENDSTQALFGGVYVFRSTQNGNFPSQVPNAYSVHADVHDIVSNPLDPNKIYILTDGGLYRSNNYGTTFYDCTDGYVTGQVYMGSVSRQDPNLMLAGLQDNNTLIYNGSPYWDRVIGGDGSFNAIDPTDDFTMYGSLQYLNVLKSDDRGFSFNYILQHSSSPFGNNSTAFIAPFVVCPSATNVLYAGSDSLLRSDNGGFNWRSTNGSQLDAGNVVLSIAVSATHPDTVYVSTAPTPSRSMKIFRSYDGGQSFTDVSTGLPNRYPRDLEVNPQNSQMLYAAFSGFGSGHLFRSVDGGSSWNDISSNLPDIPFHAILVHPLYPDTLFAGSDLGVFVSMDAGLSWAAFNDGLPDGVMVFDLQYSWADGQLLAFTHGNGVYKVNLQNLPVGIPSTIVKGNSELNVRYNPIDQSLKFQISGNDFHPVSFRIIDMRGRELFNGKLNSTEQQKVLYTGAQVSGTYLIQIIGKKGQLSKKYIVY